MKILLCFDFGFIEYFFSLAVILGIGGIGLFIIGGFIYVISEALKCKV